MQSLYKFKSILAPSPPPLLFLHHFSSLLLPTPSVYLRTFLVRNVGSDGLNGSVTFRPYGLLGPWFPFFEVVQEHPRPISFLRGSSFRVSLKFKTFSVLPEFLSLGETLENRHRSRFIEILSGSLYVLDSFYQDRRLMLSRQTTKIDINLTYQKVRLNEM